MWYMLAEFSVGVGFEPAPTHGENGCEPANKPVSSMFD